MSSAEIMALINKKRRELQQLRVTKIQVSKTYDAVDCMALKFTSAGALINEAGTIGGVPFDNGSTTTVGQNLQKISNDALGLSKQVEGTIADLEAEISRLYAAYEAALAAERAAAEEAERAAKASNKK